MMISLDYNSIATALALNAVFFPAQTVGRFHACGYQGSRHAGQDAVLTGSDGVTVMESLTQRKRMPISTLADPKIILPAIGARSTSSHSRQRPGARRDLAIADRTDLHAPAHLVARATELGPVPQFRRFQPVIMARTRFSRCSMLASRTPRT